MNNRIMAMLFALAAAMFISIVPVKAEAAHTHVDSNKNCVCDVDGCTETMHVAGTKWEHDKDGHFQKCVNCGVSMNRAAHTAGEVKVYPSDKTKHFQQCTVCLRSMNIAEHVEGNLKNCKCADCKYEWEHEYEEGKYNQYPDGHNQKCKNCDVTTEKVAHNLVWTKTEAGHTAVCSDCGYVKVAQTAHTYGAASDNEDGTHTRTCTVEGCGFELVEDHVDYTGSCVCSLSGCGAKLDHETGDWLKDITGHWKHCSNCDENVEFLAGHNYGEAEAVEGHTYHVKACADCGFERQFDCTSADEDCLCDECGTLVKHVAADMEIVGRVEATCEKDGNIGYNKCKTCGQAFAKNGDKYTLYTESVVLEKTGHKFGGEGYGWRETEDGTAHFKKCINGCGTNVYSTADGVVVGEEAHSHGSWYDNEAGQHCEICAVCGEAYGDEAHDYKTPVQTTVLNGAGKQQHGLQCECGAVLYRLCSFNDECVCSVCGAEKIHAMADVQGYGYKAPTCTETGLEWYAICKTCDAYFLTGSGKLVATTEDGIMIPALGHEWEARQDTLNGQHLQRCTRNGCGVFQTLDCADTTGDCLCDVNNCGKLVHSHKLVFHSPVAPTCEEAGTEGYFTYLECDKKMFDLDMKEIAAPVEVAATDHTPSGEWTANGDVHEELCADCDEVLESAEHVDVNGDNRCDDCDVALALELMPEKPATCTDIGYKACWISPVSQRMYSDAEGRNHITSREVIPALGHKETGWVDQGGETHKMSCQRTGCTWSKTENHSGDNDCYCEVCGGYYVGHQLYEVEMVPATCSKAGTQAYYECECGQLYDLSYHQISAPKAIAQLKHDMNPTVKKDAKENKHYIQCKNCDYKLYENHGMVLSDPNKGNYHQWLCDCGELEIETHYDKNGDNKCDVCDHSMNGSSSDKVEQHDNKTVYTGEKNTVTATKDWWWNWQEWFTPSNSGGSGATGNTEENTTSSTGTAVNGSSNSGTANNGTTNNGGNVEEDVVTPPAGNEGVDERSVSTSGQTTTVTESQASVITQFITWFLSLFGF